MTDRPILFSAPMVRALLAGTKTQTRRILKHQPPELSTFVGFYSVPLSGAFQCKLQGEKTLLTQRVPYSAGDRLWVRETWQGLSFGDYLPTKSCQCEVRYAATDPCADLDAEARGYPWRPSIFMPRFASRLTLTVTDVRVERLQDISSEDAIAEGVVDTGRRDGAPYSHFTIKDVPGITIEHEPETVYAQLWEMINGEGSWSANPWVVAYSFSVQHSNIDQLAKEAA